LHAAKSEAILQRERNMLLATEETFRALGDKDRLLARPWQLRLVAFPAGGFTQLARHAPATLPNAEAHLRLLNGAYPDGVIKPGTLVKVVE
jgi:predicted Zn-dependent protease